MSPRQTAHDVAHVGLANTEDQGEFHLSFARRIPAADLNHIASGELRQTHPLATSNSLGMRSCTTPVTARKTFGVKLRPVDRCRLGLGPAAFCDTVLHILGWRSEEQVIGPDARRVVAVVANVHPVRNWSVSEFPCQSVRRHRSVLDAEFAVPGGGSSTLPFPAIPGLIHLLPKAGFERTTLAILRVIHRFILPQSSLWYPCK